MALDIKRLDQDLGIIDKIYSLAVKGLVNENEKKILIESVKEDVANTLEKAFPAKKEKPEAKPAPPTEPSS